MDPISYARYGLSAATQRLDGAIAKAARDCANPATDLTQGISAVQQNKAQFKAAIKIDRIAQEMWREMIKAQAEGR